MIHIPTAYIPCTLHRPHSRPNRLRIPKQPARIGDILDGKQPLVGRLIVIHPVSLVAGQARIDVVRNGAPLGRGLGGREGVVEAVDEWDDGGRREGRRDGGGVAVVLDPPEAGAVRVG